MSDILHDVEDLTTAVQVAAGAASVCWVGGPGDAEFDSSKCLEVSGELIDWINKRYVSRVAAEEMAQQRVGDFQKKIRPQGRGAMTDPRRLAGVLSQGITTQEEKHE